MDVIAPQESFFQAISQNFSFNPPPPLRKIVGSPSFVAGGGRRMTTFLLWASGEMIDDIKREKFASGRDGPMYTMLYPVAPIHIHHPRVTGRSSNVMKLFIQHRGYQHIPTEIKKRVLSCYFFFWKMWEKVFNHGDGCEEIFCSTRSEWFFFTLRMLLKFSCIDMGGKNGESDLVCLV